MNVLVTGHNGFLGRAITHELVSRGHWVRLFHGDVRNAESVTKQVRYQELVIHLAAKTPGRGIDSPDWYGSHNVTGALNVAEAAFGRNIPLIFAATRLTEGPYGQSKAAAEQILREEFGAHAVRVSMAYGPGQEPPEPWGGGAVRLIPVWVCSALTQQPIRITGDRDSVPDLIYIDDVADAFADLVESHGAGERLPPTLEVAGPGRHSLNDIAEHVAAEAARYTGRGVEIQIAPRTACDPPAGERGNGVSLKTGLRRTVAYYRALLDR